MGNAQSSNSVTSIIRVVATVITSTMQRFANTVKLSQTIDADCTDFINGIDAEIQICRQLLLDQGVAAEDIRRACDVPIAGFARCGGDQITLLQAVNLNLDATQRQEAISEIIQDIESQIESAIQASSGLLTFNEQTHAAVNQLIEAVTSAISAGENELYLDVVGRQSVRWNGGTVSFVTLEQNIDNVSRLLQANTNVNNTAQTLSEQISLQLSQQSAVLRIVLWVAVAIIGTVVIVVVVLASIGIIGGSPKPNVGLTT